MRWFMIAIVLVLIAAFFTNPTESDLRGVLSTIVAAKVEERVPQGPPLPGPLGELRDKAVAAATPAIMDQIGIRRDNYFLFSVFHLDVPKVPMEKEPPACVVGAFKMLFIPMSRC
jgi:hypothetical protein